MLRRYIGLGLLCCAISLSAAHTGQLINLINQGYYEQALISANNVHNWTVPAGVELNLDSAVAFTARTRADKTRRTERKKIRLFLADVAMEQGRRLEAQDRWSDDGCLNYCFAFTTREVILGIDDSKTKDARSAFTKVEKSIFAFHKKPLPTEYYFLKKIPILETNGCSKKEIASEYKLLCRLENKLQDYTKAAIYGQKAYDIFSSLPYGSKSELSDIVSPLAFAYYNIKDYENAEKYYRIDLENFYKSATKGIPENEREYHKRLLRLAISQYKQAKYAEAVQKFKTVRDYRKNVSEKQPEDDIRLADYIAHCYYFQKKYKECIPYFNEIIKYERNEGKQGTNKFIEKEFKLGISYYRIKKYQSSVKCFQEVADFYKKAPEMHAEYVLSSRWLGYAYYYNKQYTKAISFLELVMSEIEQSDNTDNDAYLSVLLNLGDCYEKKYLYTKAETTYQKVLVNLKSSNNTSDKRYFNTLKKVGDIYFNQGRNEDVKTAYSEYLSLYEAQRNVDCNDVIDARVKLANIYMDAGDYAQSEKNYLSTLDMALSEQCPDADASLPYNNLYVLYHRMGDNERSHKLIRNAVQTMNREGKEDNPMYCVILNNLGDSFRRKGDVAKATQCFERALEVATKQNDKDLMYLSYGNLALVYDTSDKGEEYFKKSLELMETEGNERALDKVNILSNLIDYYVGRKQYSKAEPYVQTIEDVISKYNLENNPGIADALSRIAVLYNYMQRYDKAVEYTQKMLALRKIQFAQAVDFMSEQQREYLWENIDINFILGNVFCYNGYSRNIPQSSAVAYDAELFRKGVLLSSANTINHSILESGNEQLINQWDYLKGLKRELQQQQVLDSAREYKLREIERLEKEIVAQSAEYRKSSEMPKQTWRDVQKSLKKKEVAIEFMEVFGRGDTAEYCALLVRHDSPQPELIPLFTNIDILPILEQEKGNPNALYTYTERGQELSGYIWKKLAKHIQSKETVYFAPTGILHQIAIEALPQSPKKTYGDIYHLIRLTSTRELIRRDEEGEYKSAILYGGIDYTLESEEMAHYSSKYNTDAMFAMRDLCADSVDRGSISYLDSTLVEVNNIAEVLNEKQIVTTTYSGAEANEESFKSISGKHPDIIHIATHGFYWTDSVAKQSKYFARKKNENNVSIDPMRRSGLLFAGAALAFKGYASKLPPNVQDGILTAKELSLMDLTGVDLVVLSACETGKGDVKGEGVYGLQRAFKMAGAQTIIMSLWQVEDAATKTIMSEFYKQWQMKHKSKRDAFVVAQKKVRKQYPKPRSWAAFVLLD